MVSGTRVGDRLEAMGFSRTPGDRGSRFMRLLGIGAGIIVLLFLIPNTVTYVNPGYVGIVIHRAGGGVDSKPLGPGLHMRNPLTTGIEEYPVFMQTLVLTKASNEGSPNNDEINVNSKEGQPISLDVSMSFELDPDKAPFLYTSFRRDIASIQHPPITKQRPHGHLRICTRSRCGWPWHHGIEWLRTYGRWTSRSSCFAE